MSSHLLTPNHILQNITRTYEPLQNIIKLLGYCHHSLDKDILPTAQLKHRKKNAVNDDVLWIIDVLFNHLRIQWQTQRHVNRVKMHIVHTVPEILIVIQSLF